jgi:ABC-type arginine transport system permease subunit
MTTRSGWYERGQPSGNGSSGYELTMVSKLSEMAAEQRATNAILEDIRTQLRQEFRALPEQIARALSYFTHQQQAEAPHPRAGEKVGRMRQAIELLQAGHPYVTVLRRLPLLFALYLIIVAGNYDPQTVIDLLVGLINRVLTGS